MTKRSGTTAIVNLRFSRKYSSYHFSTEVAERSSRKLAKNRGIQRPSAYQAVDGTSAESAESYAMRACPEQIRTGQSPLLAPSPLAEQRDGASRPAPAGFETEWLYRFVTDVRDCFFDGIGRVN